MIVQAARTASQPRAVKAGREWRWIALAVAVSAGAFSSYLYWPYFERWLLEKTPEVPVEVISNAPLPAPRPEVLPDIDPKVARLGTDSSLSPVPLALVLVGTSPGRNAHEGSASLGTDARNPQVYGAGALLENGARLVEIHHDHVVLERNGVLATLSIGGMPAETLSRGNVLQPHGPQRMDTPDDILRVGGNVPIATSKRVSRPAIDIVSEALRAQNVYDTSGLIGFQLYPGARRGVFEKMGLKSGDVIQFIQGQPISVDEQWREISGALNDGAVVDVTVSRDGALTHLSLDGLALVDASGERGSDSMPP